MNQQHRDIWARMPEDARARVNAATFCPREWLIELWDAAERWESSGKWQRAVAADESAQDELDEKLIQRCCAGEYGPDAREAVEEVVRSGQWNDRRSVLRAARQAAWMVRNGQKNRRAA